MKSHIVVTTIYCQSTLTAERLLSLGVSGDSTFIRDRMTQFYNAPKLSNSEVSLSMTLIISVKVP